MITVGRAKEIAYESIDHMRPLGTRMDNHTSVEFIEELEEYFAMYRGIDKIKLLDLGCAGGQFVVDMAVRGHIAVGLEGSNYNIRHKKRLGMLIHRFT